MDDSKIKLILDKVYRYVNTDPSYAQPVHDLPEDRVICVEVSEVYEYIKGLTLWEVHRLVQLAISPRSET